MNKGSVVKSLVWVLLLLCFFVTPLALIWRLSQAEIAAYEPPVQMDVLLGAYGEAVRPVREDVREYVTVNASVISDSIAYQELTMDDPGKIRWIVRTGVAVSAGDVLGYWEGEPVKAAYTGVFQEYSLSSGDAYLRFDTFDKLVLVCDVDELSLSYLEEAADYLTTEMGKKVTLERVSPLPNADGTTTVHLTVAEAEYYCGQYVKNLNISTGRVYPNVLTLDIDCVYQKPGEPETYYVREVTRQGAFVAEHKVTVSYRSATFVSIAGVEEGKYYDSGYKAVIEGGA